MKIKKYKIEILNEKSINVLKKEMAIAILKDIDESIDSFQFLKEEDPVLEKSYLILEIHFSDNCLTTFRSFKIEVPSDDYLEKEFENKKINFWERLKLSFNFLFKNKRECFQKIFKRKEK